MIQVIRFALIFCLIVNSVRAADNTQGVLISLDTTSTPAPYIPDIPDVKMFKSQPALAPAFNMDDYNTGGVATTDSIISNFLTLSSITGSTVYQGGYSSSTVGLNQYLVGNSLSSVTITNKVKYSTYKIKKLPQMELYANGSTLVDVSAYAINSVGSALPPSFGTSSAIIVSDLSLATAYWDTTSTKVVIKTFSGFNAGTTPINIDVIASPTLFPFGSDIDREQISVYPIISTTAFDFNNSSDTGLFAYQIPAGAMSLPTISYISSINDSLGVSSHGGAMVITFSDALDGVKITPKPSSSIWLSNQSGSYYVLRVRAFGTNKTNNFLQVLYNGVPGTTPTDISGYYRFAMPTTWTTMDIPLISYTPVSSGNVMFPQLVIKFNVAGSGIVYIDEMHIFQATPPLIGSSRYKTSDNFIGGYWNDTTAYNSWSIQNISGTDITNVSNGSLNITLNSFYSQCGVKFTALNNPLTIYIANANANHQFGIHMQTSLVGGSPDLAMTQVQINALGALGATGANSLKLVGDIAAVAEVGRVSPRILRLAFNPCNPYYQIQFVIKGINNEVIQIDNVEADVDNDDPNYGDYNLFP